MKKKYKKYIFFSIIIIVFGLIYILNNKTHLVSDDYIYHFLFANRTPTDATKLIENPIDIFSSMYNHWHLWGGRLSVHYLLQFVFMFGANIFNIVNSIMFVILGILIYKHINNSKKIKIMLLLFIYSMIFLFVPQPGSTIFWKSGSANYLWSSVLMLCMTLIYKKQYDNNNIKDNTKNFALIFLLGLIVGLCNENSGCALILVEILFILIYKYRYKKIPKWAISGLIGTIIGYVFLIMAPGNYVRANVMYNKKEYSLENMFKEFLILTKLSYSYLKTVIILTVISLIIIYKKNESLTKLIDKYCIQIIFLLFTLASIYSLIVSPAYPERCWFFAFVYLLIIIGINLNYFDYKKEYINKLVIIFISIITITAISEYGQAYYNIDESYNELKNQLVSIENQINNGQKDIVVHAIYNHIGKYNAFTENGYLTSDANSWFNRWMAEYYNVDSIVAID